MKAAWRSVCATHFTIQPSVSQKDTALRIILYSRKQYGYKIQNWPFQKTTCNNKRGFISTGDLLLLSSTDIYKLGKIQGVSRGTTFYANCSGCPKKTYDHCNICNLAWKKCRLRILPVFQETLPYSRTSMVNFSWHFERSWVGTFYFPPLYWLPSLKLCLVAMETNIDLKQMKLVTELL